MYEETGGCPWIGVVGAGEGALGYGGGAVASEEGTGIRAWSDGSDHWAHTGTRVG